MESKITQKKTWDDLLRVGIAPDFTGICYEKLQKVPTKWEGQH